MRDDLRRAFLEQATACQALGSAFTASLMQILPEVLEDAPRLFAVCESWEGNLGPYGASLPLRIAGGLHALVRSGEEVALAACYPPIHGGGLREAVSFVLARRDAWLCDWVQSPPQTNETGRSAALIPAAMLLSAQTGLPLRLSELGASAGLNLNFDKYRLLAAGQAFGPDHGVTLSPRWQGDAPVAAALRVVERRGVDLSPIDARRDGARLLAYVWPDQSERMARLAAALQIAQDAPPAVDRGDAAAWLEARLSRPVPGACHMVFHTIAHQYFPDETQARIRIAMEAAGATATHDRPLAWVGMEADGAGEGAGLTLRLWPGNLSLSLGRAGFHGQWISWQNPF